MIKKLISTVLILLFFNGCSFIMHVLPEYEVDSENKERVEEEKKKKEKRRKASKKIERGL